QGWLRAEGCAVQGPLGNARDRKQANDPADDLATKPVRAALQRVSRRALAGAAGLLSVRLEVAAAGHVKRATPLVDTLVAVGKDERAPSRATRAVVGALERARFPPAKGPSTVVAPIAVADGVAKAG